MTTRPPSAVRSHHDTHLPRPRPNSAQPSNLRSSIGLLEHGENPNDWTVHAVWASDDVYAVVLEGDADVRAFTVASASEGYMVMEATEG